MSNKQARMQLNIAWLPLQHADHGNLRKVASLMSQSIMILGEIHHSQQAHTAMTVISFLVLGGY